MRRWSTALLPLLLLITFSAFATPVSAAAGAEVIDIAVFYSFGQEVTFQAQLQPADDWGEVNLFLQPEGYPARVVPVTPATDGGIIVRYNLTENPLPAFTPVTYWFRVVSKDGQETTSPQNIFSYDDNRFDWQQLESDSFEVFWYDRDVSFGQEVLNTAVQGLESAQTYLPGDVNAPVRIFVYASSADFQQALQDHTTTWAVGHASPALKTIVVSIPPGPEELLELERQVPHELAHLAQYSLAGDGYAQIPTWLQEGSASLAELYPNPDYQSVLANAVQTNSLIPIAQLCAPFPREASAAFLSYAESASFVRYLHQNYGTSGLGQLVQLYADGIGCAEGPQRAWGVALTELEYRWRQETLGMNMASQVFNNLLPYLILLVLLVAIPILVAAFTRLRNSPGKSIRQA